MAPDLRLVDKGDAGSTHPPLQNGDGGGTSSDMETRVKLLEYRADQTEKLMVRMDGKLDLLVRDVSEIKGKISNMPSTWQTVTFVLGIVLFIFTFMKLALHM